MQLENEFLRSCEYGDLYKVKSIIQSGEVSIFCTDDLNSNVGERNGLYYSLLNNQMHIVEYLSTITSNKLINDLILSDYFINSSVKLLSL